MNNELVALLREFAARLVTENGGSDSARVREQLRIVNDTAKAILVAQYRTGKKSLLGQHPRGKANRGRRNRSSKAVRRTAYRSKPASSIGMSKLGRSGSEITH